MTNGSSEVRQAFDTVIPDRYFPPCKCDIPSLNGPYCLVEGGVGLGALVINQSNHLFSRSARAKLSDVLRRPILSGSYFQKVATATISARVARCILIYQHRLHHLDAYTPLRLNKPANARVRPTLEVILTESPRHLIRRRDGSRYRTPPAPILVALS